MADTILLEIYEKYAKGLDDPKARVVIEEAINIISKCVVPEGLITSISNKLQLDRKYVARVIRGAATYKTKVIAPYDIAESI